MVRDRSRFLLNLNGIALGSSHNFFPFVVFHSSTISAVSKLETPQLKIPPSSRSFSIPSIVSSKGKKVPTKQVLCHIHFGIFCVSH